VHTLEHINRTLGLKWGGTSVLSYVQAPFISAQTLEEALYTLILNSADSAFAVREVEEDLYKRSSHGLVPITPQVRMKSDFDVVYATVPSSSAIRNSNLKTGSLTGARISHFIIPQEETFFIRTKRDYEIAKILKGKTLMQAPLTRR